MITPNPGDDLPCPCMGPENPLGRFYCKKTFEHILLSFIVEHTVLSIFPIADHRFACDSLAATCDSFTAASESSCADFKSKTKGTTNPWQRASACGTLAEAFQSFRNDFHSM